jgi:hypothetical protein
MKRRVFPILILFVAAVFVNSCKKTSNSDTRHTGKLVADGGCGHYIVQLIDSTAADSTFLTKSWTDPLTDSTYTNVFTVSDVCTFQEIADIDHVMVGSVFLFTLNGPVPPQICNECDVLPFNMPAASNSVTNLELVTVQ